MDECILFTFTSDKKYLGNVIRKLENYSVKTIVNLSKDYQLESYESRHLVDYALESGRQFRETANKWVLDIGKTRLESGKTLVESLLYKDIPVWWFVELGLQEKSFQIIRFVETVNFILDKKGVNVFAVAGDDEPSWTRPLLTRIGLARGIKLLDLGSFVTKEIESSAKQIRIIDKGLGSLTTQEIESSAKQIRIIGKVLTNRQKYLRKIFLVISSVPLAFTFLFIPSPNKISVSAKFKAVVIRIIKSQSELSLLQIISYVAHSLGINTYLNLQLGRTILAIRIINRVLRSVPLNSTRKFLHVLSNFKQILRFKKQKPKTGSILVLCEAGAVRTRRSLVDYHKSQYHPYLENIPQAIRKKAEKEKLEVRCLYYGSSIIGSPNLLDEDSILKFSDFLRNKHLDVQNNFNKKINEFIEKLSDDNNMRTALNYHMIDLSYFIIDDLINLYKNAGHFILYLEIFQDVIDKIMPTIVVMNNYEGVFRNIVASCIMNNIASVGIQQALGPYVHALNKLDYNLKSLQNNNSLGFPIPQKIFLWGKAHEKNFLRYGFDKNILNVSGYCRLDTFVNERSHIDPILIKKRLEIPEDSKIILFAGTFHPPNVYVTLEDNFIKTIKELEKVTQSMPSTYVLVKPWSGDKINNIIELVKKFGNDKFIFVHPSTEVHNVELLSITNVLIGSFSSIFAEAAIMGCNIIFMDYPEAIFYDEAKHIELIESFVHKIHGPQQVYDSVIDSLNKKPIR
ncbi:MAG TPA: CDP-glycerol glycerophosphotransferase family protein, partial [Candidatus Nitrosotalea sp.]|nr:CDP-glycerol glycerophosphotransferase family protein [Candidatus Nitrosotalea sp.]